MPDDQPAKPVKPVPTDMIRGKGGPRQIPTRQKWRHALILFALLLFPVTLNYFSPYVSITGLAAGYITLSVAVFAGQFISSLIFGRLFCGWICPAAGLNEACQHVNNRIINRRWPHLVRWIIFAIWFGVLILVTLISKKVPSLNLWYMTESIVSVSEPIRFAMYYTVIAAFLLLNLVLGRRASCHTICWMAPFMIGGDRIGRLLHLPQYKIRTSPEACISCGRCSKNCPMSIPVQSYVAKGIISDPDCMLCGECIDICPCHVLEYGFRRK